MIQDLRERGIYLTDYEYRTGLRSLFTEDYQELYDEDLEDILYGKIAQMSPSEAEGFLSSIGHFLKNSVAPIALSALPAVAGIAGTAIGGPIGAAAGNAIGGFAANAISGATNIKPNPVGASIANAASSIAGGNLQAVIPNIVNAGKDIGNAFSPGAGNKFANVASNVAQAASYIANGNYQGAVPNIGNAINAIAPGAGDKIASAAKQLTNSTQSGAKPNQASSPSQLLSFLQSSPFLQSLLSTIATGNMGTAVQIPSEDGTVNNASYLGMLESLKYLTENAIIEADNAGFSTSLNIETEADKGAYIEDLIESIHAYENAQLPNYDKITYN